jgi:hypothetical protein
MKSFSWLIVSLICLICTAGIGYGQNTKIQYTEGAFEQIVEGDMPFYQIKTPQNETVDFLLEATSKYDKKIKTGTPVRVYWQEKMIYINQLESKEKYKCVFNVTLQPKKSK